jgi:PilZ domain-containing protein
MMFRVSEFSSSPPVQPGDVRRREERYVTSISITLHRFAVKPVITSGVTLDVSCHGMSFLAPTMPRVGETVAIAAQRAGASLNLLAKVRHSSATGSGVEFLVFSANTREGIDEWIHELQSDEQSAFFCRYLNLDRESLD